MKARLHSRYRAAVETVEGRIARSPKSFSGAVRLLYPNSGPDDSTRYRHSKKRPAMLQKDASQHASQQTDA